MFKLGLKRFSQARARSVRSVNNILAGSSVRLNSSSASSSLSNKSFTWTDFFKLRKEQRTINIASSIVTAFIGSIISWGYISNVDIDPTELIFGFDPFMVYFGGFLLSTGVGYMFGPLLGSGLFKAKNRELLNVFQNKNKVFLEHVAKNRVDPSFQSFSNPVPDYYGEKINSLKSYAQWLRDNNAYKRKTREFL